MQSHLESAKKSSSVVRQSVIRTCDTVPGALNTTPAHDEASRFWTFLRTVRWRRLLSGAAVLGIILVVGLLYLQPASTNLLAGKTSTFLGDGGGDPQTLPFYDSQIVETFRKHPSYLLYGAVYSPQTLAPVGVPMWVPWIERIVVVFVSFFTMDASRLIAIVAWMLMSLSAICFYGYARSMKWSPALSLTLALCWAFNPFTRARIDAHVALAATYYLPLVFWGLELAKQAAPETGKSRRNTLIFAALAIVGATMAAHYFVVSLLFLSPFCALYFFLTRDRSVSWKRNTVTLLVAAIPGVLFLGWNILKAVPSGVLPEGESAVPVNDQTQILYDLAARPQDYLGGDVRFGDDDWNPLRAAVNVFITHPNRMNSAECANGIRWALLLIVLVGGVSLLFPRVRKRFEREAKLQLVALFAFGLMAFLLSMPPNFIKIGGVELGPSRLAFKIIRNFRCPCRVGPSVHFAVLVMAGTFLHQWAKGTWFEVQAARRTMVFGFVLPLVLLDYPPAKPLIMASMRRPRVELEPAHLRKDPVGCGMGMYIPAPNGWEWDTRTQEFYGTSCRIMDPPASLLLRKDDVTSVARCAKLSWIVYSGAPSLLDEVCGELGWDRVSKDSCRSPQTIPPARDVKACAPVH